MLNDSAYILGGVGRLDDPDARLTWPEADGPEDLGGDAVTSSYSPVDPAPRTPSAPPRECRGRGGPSPRRPSAEGARGPGAAWDRRADGECVRRARSGGRRLARRWGSSR